VSAADTYLRVVDAVERLSKRGAVSVTEVARAARLPHRTALAVLESLESAGSVARLARSTFAVTGPLRRRIQLFVLTPDIGLSDVIALL